MLQQAEISFDTTVTEHRASWPLCNMRRADTNRSHADGSVR